MNDPAPDDTRAAVPTPDGPTGPQRPVDPVVARRRLVAHWVKIAKRVGYSLLAVFCVLGAIGFPTGFPGWLTTTAIITIAAGSVLLAPALVLGYAVKAADREDREGDWR